MVGEQTDQIARVDELIREQRVEELRSKVHGFVDKVLSTES